MRVLELGDYVAAAYCTKELARWGAEVVKVELPRGDMSRTVGPFRDGMPDPETSGLFLALNGGKQGVALDYTESEGADLLTRLIDSSDIIVSNLNPATVEHLGLPDYAAAHPDKVVVSITPFGLTGPYRDWEHTTGVTLALGGYLMLMGDLDREPLLMPGWYPDEQAGIYAYTIALAAWLGRATNPVGRLLDISTVEVLASLHQFTTVQWSYAGQVRRRNGNRWERLHPINLMPCKDGWVGLAITTEPFWKQFTKMIGRPEMGEDPRFRTGVQRRALADEIDEVVGPWLLERTMADILHEGQEVWRVPAGMAMGPAELLEDRHLAARAFWQQVQHPATGPLSYPSSSFRLQGRAPVERRAPLLGEHNDVILGPLLASGAAARQRQTEVV